MENLIPIMNRLQDVFNAVGFDASQNVGLDLPQIVVVGSQSSGKSSVLEAIVGRDFLPRGSGIVTRRPLVLQLINLPWDGSAKSEAESEFAEWGEFLHKPNEMFYDFSNIRKEIEKETDRLTGKNKGISSDPISLKIYSPYVLNLTLVDLPGMTRVPVGDQPPDIEMRIRRMILRYIQPQNSIILAVSPANTDMANSDALQLAKEVDPDGRRTLGVITKVDIMDKGTDALDMLMGRVISLRLGFIGVVNRSQQDIIDKVPIRQALKKEKAYFEAHPVYGTISKRMGTPYLSKTLNKLLINHIKDCLPELKAKINKMMAETQLELRGYGDPLFDDSKNSQGALLLQIITRFSNDYSSAIDGRLTDLSHQELYGGARINYIFSEVFSKRLDEIDPLDQLTLNDIRTAIRNATGPRSALFIPEVSFDLLVKAQIARLEEPAIRCVDLVYDELQRIVAQIETPELLRFHQLRERLTEVVERLLQACRDPTKRMIGDTIAIEKAYINTNHPDFVGGDGAMQKVLERLQEKRLAEAEGAQNQQSGWGQANSSDHQRQIEQRQREASERERRAQLAQQQQQQQQQQSSSSSRSKDAQGQQGQQQQGFLNIFFGKKDDKGAHIQAVANNPRNEKERRAALEYQRRLEQQQQNQSSSSSSSGSSSSSSSSSRRKDMEVVRSIKPVGRGTTKEEFETELIKSLLESYFGIVRKNIKDTTPKSVMHFLVNRSKEQVQNKLVAELYREDLFADLLQENDHVAKRRKACKEMLEVLRKAIAVLNEVRDAQ